MNLNKLVLTNINEPRRRSSASTGPQVIASASFSLIQTKPTSLESYSSSISSNSCHLSASESISSKSANLIFIPQQQKQLQKETMSSSSSSASSKSSSTSSVFAGLSVLSFSESNSIPSLSSSISYSDATELDCNNNNRPLINLKKQFNSSFTFSSNSSKKINSEMISELVAPYKSKPFYGKEWFYTKLNDYLLNKKMILNECETMSSSESSSSGLSSYIQSNKSLDIIKPSCLVLIGDSGTGKTHLSCELKWPTNLTNSDLLSINKQLLSVYFLNWFNSKQNCLKQFYSHLSRTIQDLNETIKPKIKLDLNDYLYNESDYDLENDYTEQYVTKLANDFNETILKQLEHLKMDQNYYILIDGFDDALMLAHRLEAKKSFSQNNNQLTSVEMILMFLNKTFSSYPHWLNLILTAKNCNEELYFKKYLNNIKYDKMSMDKCVNIDPITPTTDLSLHSFSSFNSKATDSVELCNAAHFANLKDIQTYILKRLDNDLILKKKFNKSNAIEMFNLLLIKSNFCLLYVEKVLDLISSDFINSNEITKIPATLNGLYLYLIETILLKTQQYDESAINAKELLYSILSICLIEPMQFDKETTFKRLRARFMTLSFDYYETIFDLIAPIFFTSNYLRQKSLILFHSSLAHWLTDIKFCTQNYLINLNEAHFSLSFYYLNQLRVTKDDLNWTKFKYHLANSETVLTELSLNYFYLLCESELIETKFNTEIIDYSKIFNDSLMPKTVSSNENIPFILFDLITKGDLTQIKQTIQNMPSLENRLINITDSYNQTTLIVAVKLNNFEIVEYLTKIPLLNLDHCDNSGWTSLRYSSWMGNENIVNILLESGALIDACDSEGRTALRAAVFSGHEHIVRLLLANDANVNKCDTDNRSVLHVAVYMGHIGLVDLLLSKGALVNQQDSLGRNILSTVLFSTVANTQLQLDITERLIKHHADLNQCDNENKTSLILAVLENNIPFVNLLIQNNADLDAIDHDGHTAITYAVKNNLFSLVDLLLKHNAATHILDKEGRSILSIACSVGAKEVLRLLMDRGLDEMHRDNFGWTPLHEAAFAGYLDIAQMLLDYGSEIDAIDNDGKTSLFYACQEGYLDMVELLLNNFADVNVRSHQGTTPFRVACLENRLTICQYIIENKDIDINYLDPDCRTTLYCLVCSTNKNIEMIKFLLDNNASCNTIDLDGRTCLHVAASQGDLETFSLLVKYNSNLEAIDINGNTPLLTATWNDKLNIVKYLLNENVCKIDHLDNQGATALSIASQKGNYDIVNELLQHGAEIYASSRNPIKLAHQTNNTEIVKLLQQWSTMCYDLNRFKEGEELKKNSSITSVPRNSKSVDSFRLTNRFNNNNEKFVPTFTNRCVATPTTFSSYIKYSPSSQENTTVSCRMPTSISASPGTYDYAKIEDLNRRFLNKNNFDQHKDELKSSRFKQVKDKLLRKSSTLIVTNPSSSTPKNHLKTSESPTTPTGNKSVASFRLFISSLNGSNDQHKQSSSYLPTSASSSKLKNSKSISNNTFVQMIRKKLKFLKSPSSSFGPNYHYSHQNFDDLSNQNDPIIINGKQMHRSVTDTIAATYNKDTLTNSISFIKSKPVEDDVAHIFNRNSLNDCLNPRCSFRECDSSLIKKPTSNYSSYMLINSNHSTNVKGNNSVGTSSSSSSSSNTSTDYYNKNAQNNNNFKRPNCLPLNYFKKETSI